MFSNITTTYDWKDATVEIIIILLVVFTLWIVIWNLLKRLDDKKQAKQKTKKDNLKIIQWIWEKIEKTLNKNKIHTFIDLINTKENEIKKILKKQIKKKKNYHIETWTNQSELALESKWQELKKYQNLIKKNAK